jgi:hypothetical protein
MQCDHEPGFRPRRVDFASALETEFGARERVLQADKGWLPGLISALLRHRSIGSRCSSTGPSNSKPSSNKDQANAEERL